jgi:hypothetical protein
VEFTIEAASVAAFARALGMEPDGTVPPTYAAVYGLGQTVPQLLADPGAGVRLDHLLHAEQEFRWHRHPRVGETVVARGRIASDLERRGLRLIAFETEVTCRNEPLCWCRSLFAVRP